MTMNERTVLEYVCTQFGAGFGRIWAETRMSPEDAQEALAGLMARGFLSRKEGKYNHTALGLRAARTEALAQTASESATGDEKLTALRTTSIDIDGLVDEIVNLKAANERLTRELSAERAKIESALAVGVFNSAYLDNTDSMGFEAVGWNNARAEFRKRLTDDD